MFLPADTRGAGQGSFGMGTVHGAGNDDDGFMGWWNLITDSQPHLREPNEKIATITFPRSGAGTGQLLGNCSRSANRGWSITHFVSAYCVVGWSKSYRS